MNAQASKRRFYAVLTGTFVVMLCCFTPVLVIALAAAGLGALTPYLDYVLFPALGALTVVTVLSYRKWGRTQV
jgi:mercuric ion transport protein